MLRFLLELLKKKRYETDFDLIDVPTITSDLGYEEFDRFLDEVSKCKENRIRNGYQIYSLSFCVVTSDAPITNHKEQRIVGILTSGRFYRS